MQQDGEANVQGNGACLGNRVRLCRRLENILNELEAGCIQGF